MNKMIGLFILASMVTFISPARADLSNTTLLSLDVMYLDREYEDSGTQTKSKQTDLDLKITRVVKAWSYGAIYVTNSSDPAQSSRTSYGLSGGYFSDKDFYINFHYFLSSKYNLGPGAQYSKGTGYGIDLGFLTKITSSFLAGLMLSQRNYSYTEVSAGGVSASTSATHKELIPMFTLAVAFQ